MVPEVAADLMDDPTMRRGVGMEVQEVGWWFSAVLLDLEQRKGNVHLTCSPFYARWEDGHFLEPPAKLTLVVFVPTSVPVHFHDDDYMMWVGDRTVRITPRVRDAISRLSLLLTSSIPPRPQA